MESLHGLLLQADRLRFKLLAIIGQDRVKKNKIIKYLESLSWTVVDVENELVPIKNEIEKNEADEDFELGTKIKEWFNSKPDRLILVNASILYHDIFLKISPIGAFKYNSRNKNCMLFLEDEEKLGNRIYYGKFGTDEYYDKEISDIRLVHIDEISDNFIKEPEQEYGVSTGLSQDSIGNFFNFQVIKDVIDIDADLKEDAQRRELVSSYILSGSLEEQIADFFIDLEKPTHKARTIIGNYGSGKSHLVGFLVSLLENPSLVSCVRSTKITTAVRKLGRSFFHVQFELQTGQVELKKWFYGKVRKQLKEKYGITIPPFNFKEQFDDKENIQSIMDIVKKTNPAAGLVIVIDEVSDFLAARHKEAMKSDLQFLRVVGQVCQDQDVMFVASMQEDVFSSPKFRDVAAEIGRVGERFQNIMIHKEDVQKVISTRIVPKTDEQKHRLEERLSEFAAYIPPVSSNIEDYINLFPLTPFLLDMFTSLTYFDKRGVIQFAINEIKNILHFPFPCFITFDRIYDVLAENPNKKNLEEIYEIIKVVNILKEKINLLEEKYKKDAIRIIKALAIYSLWDTKATGATAEELAYNLMLVPRNKKLSAGDNIGLMIKNIRDVTYGEYIKADKDEASQKIYFRFETKVGIDPEERIQQKASAVSDSEIEQEIFKQLYEILELEHVNGKPDVFDDECEWESVKSYRKGYIVFVKNHTEIGQLPERDYALVIVSPFVKSFQQTISENQIVIKLDIPGEPENIQQFKEIVAIRQLINSNIQTTIMHRKLDGRINGYKQGSVNITGIKYRLAKLLINYAQCTFNNSKESIKHHIGKESASALEIIDTLKTLLLDRPFTKKYPEHPVYSERVWQSTIGNVCSRYAQELTRGNILNLSRAPKLFLERLNLLNSQGYPDATGSPICQSIIEILKTNKGKVTSIRDEMVSVFAKAPFGLEPEVIYLYLVFLTVQGKIFLQARGGDRIDIDNIKDKFRSVNQFDTIMYAKLKENYSYDFAERLFNTLGLHGAQIKIERERLQAFRHYKEKVASILHTIETLKNTIESLKTYPSIHIDMKSVAGEFENINEIPWETLDLENHTKFGTIETLNPQLPEMEISLHKIKELQEALDEYRHTIHQAVGYMNNALALIESKSLLRIDEKNVQELKDIYAEILEICFDFSLFGDRSRRNPIKGKISNFKKIYKYDIYIPAHDRYVGKDVQWKTIDSYMENPSFKKLRELYNLKHVNSARFNIMVAEWNDLKAYKCTDASLDRDLDVHTFCQHCLFPQKERYTEIPGIINRVDEKLEEELALVEENVLKLIREYRDNLQYLKEPEKNSIGSVITANKLPDHIGSLLINAINNLLKEVDVIEVDADKVVSALFPGNQMVSPEELRRNFSSLLHELTENREENEVRIKLM
ncbi:MAG: hypothetical protein JXB88_00605 [Spirochaetales bacterium]|nr:hypothetical protein [Spirochaetales bacterium]